MKKEFEKEQNDNQIDDAFLDMPDMEDDEKFRQWLEEEYLEENFWNRSCSWIICWNEYFTSICGYN